MAKIRKKSPIHENADANITCDFGDGDINRSRSRLPHGQPHTYIVSSVIKDLFRCRLHPINVIATRTFAAQFMCSSLVDACNKYMNKHFVEVSNSPDYLDLAVADVLDLLGRDELHVENEEQVRRFFHKC